MKKNIRPKRESADEKMRRLTGYGEEAPVLIDAFSPYEKFTPVSNMPYPNGLNEFHSIFVSAAMQTGFIEYDQDHLNFRWTCKDELSSEEKSRLYKKIIEIGMEK